jgi:hypothetical protein
VTESETRRRPRDSVTVHFLLDAFGREDSSSGSDRRGLSPPVGRHQTAEHQHCDTGRHDDGHEPLGEAGTGAQSVREHRSEQDDDDGQEARPESKYDPSPNDGVSPGAVRGPSLATGLRRRYRPTPPGPEVQRLHYRLYRLHEYAVREEGREYPDEGTDGVEPCHPPVQSADRGKSFGSKYRNIMFRNIYLCLSHSESCLSSVRNQRLPCNA